MSGVYWYLSWNHKRLSCLSYFVTVFQKCSNLNFSIQVFISDLELQRNLIAHKARCSFFFFLASFVWVTGDFFFFFNAHMQMHKHSMCNQRSPKKYTDVKWKLSQSSKCLKNTQMLDRIQINHLAHQLCFFFSSSCWVLWKDNLVLCLKLNKEKAVTWVLLVLQKSFPIL